MDWSRAKTILIVFLFAVNSFLFGTYMAKENSSRRDRLQLRSEVASVLREQGISVDEEAIPTEDIGIDYATVKCVSDTKKIAETLFGEVEESFDAENVVYSASGGNLMFAGDSFSLVLEAGRMIDTPDKAEDLAKEIARKLGISVFGGEFEIENTVGGYKVAVPQNIGGVELFGAGVELNISNSGNVLGNGKFIATGRLIRAEGKTMSISSLLIEFAEDIKKSGAGKLRIVRLRHGYLPKTPAGGSVYLVPTLEVKTSSDVFYINMSDGTQSVL